MINTTKERVKTLKRNILRTLSQASLTRLNIIYKRDTTEHPGWKGFQSMSKEIVLALVFCLLSSDVVFFLKKKTIRATSSTNQNKHTGFLNQSGAKPNKLSRLPALYAGCMFPALNAGCTFSRAWQRLFVYFEL